MNYALVFRPAVRDELDEAYRWYESQRPGLGDEFLDCIDEMLNRVSVMPEAYPVVYRDVRRAVVQRFPYASYCRYLPASKTTCPLPYQKYRFIRAVAWRFIAFLQGNILNKAIASSFLA